MKSYVINLKSAHERKAYIENLFRENPSIQIQWIEAVDGRSLTQIEKESLFNFYKFKRHYMRIPRPGEIGCTLSHQKCYQEIINSNQSSALIFEDDVILNSDIESLLPYIEKFLNCKEPRLVLLSGWFWFNKKSHFVENVAICKVFDAYLTHAYALNKEAAKLMVDQKPFFLADAWELFLKRGVQIYGLSPHPIDQDWSGVFKSDVLSEKVEKSSFNFVRWFQFKFRGLRQRIFKKLNRFEAPQNFAHRISDIKEYMNEKFNYRQ